MKRQRELDTPAYASRASLRLGGVRAEERTGIRAQWVWDDMELTRSKDDAQ